MSVTAGCPECGKKIVANDRYAGKRVKCPACSQAVSLPSLGAEQTLQPHPAPLPAPPEATHDLVDSTPGTTPANRASRGWETYWPFVAGFVAVFLLLPSRKDKVPASSQTSQIASTATQTGRGHLVERSPEPTQASASVTDLGPVRASPLKPVRIGRATFTPPAVRPTPAPIPSVPSVAQNKDVDERLFLTYVLHDLYSTWPTNAANTDGLSAQIGLLRRRVDRFRDYVKTRNDDHVLPQLFADCLDALDAYADLLSEGGRIERQGVTRREAEHGEAGFNAGFTGGSIAAEAYNRGASGEDAALSGLAAGIFQFVLEESAKGQARDEAKRAAIERARRAFEAKVSATIARLENAENDLAARYGWQPHEVRSSDTQAEADELVALEKQRDVQGVLRLLDRKIARRPRDPLLLARRDYLASIRQGDSIFGAACLSQGAARCVGRAALVPAGPIYDPYRAQIAFWAADLANMAWTKELEGQAWGWTSSGTAAYAVSLWDLTLALALEDEGGECRERRAWALMASGRITEARRQADEVRDLRGNTIRYAMNYARLANADGDTSKAFEWLSYAVKTLGFNGVKLAATDPDLAATRDAHAAAFDDLMTVKWTWAIKYGVFNDDIVIENKSAFPITNVELSCDIQSNGKAWSPRLKCPKILPGQTYSWVNVLSIPGGRTDSGRAELLCDQNKP